jgi:hypothetical protein
MFPVSDEFSTSYTTTNIAVTLTHRVHDLGEPDIASWAMDKHSIGRVGMVKEQV